jgi:uncharacterized membrane protein
VTFLAPAALLLLVPAAAILVLPLLQSHADRRIAPAVLRAVVLGLVVLALAEPRVRGAATDRAVVFLIDVSRGVPEAARAEAAVFVARARTSLSAADVSAVVVFGETAAAVTPFEAPGAAGPPDLGTRVPADGTDIGAAIRFALAALPPDRIAQVVLLSDGNENLGDAVTEARRARGAGIPLAAVPLGINRLDAVAVRRVEAPEVVPPGATVTVGSILSSTRDGVPATVRLFIDGVEAASHTIVLSAGKSRGPEFRVALPGAGLHEVAVVVGAAEDGSTLDDEARAGVRVLGEGAVLLVEPEAGESIVARAIAAMGIASRRARPVEMPDNPLLLQPYDAVVLSDVAALDLTDGQLAALEVAVRDMGLGVLVLGGENAYGPGGYRDTALERLLPVRMDLREKQVLLNGALVIILHTCEFDRGNHWALRISAEAIRSLTPRDFVGLIGYGQSGDEWVLPFDRVADPGALAGRLPDLRTGDMPSYDSSLAMAETALVPCPAHLKHVVVISDGDAAQPDGELVARLAAGGITVSAVCVAPHTPSDVASMQLLAKVGRGRFFHLEEKQVAALPRIFIQEATTLRRAAVRKEPFVPELVAGGSDAHPAVRGLVAPLPRLAALTRTEAKERAETLLTGPDGDPVLAVWRYGLGTTAAFTSGLAGGFLGDWAVFEGLDRFLTQTIRAVARTAGRSGFAATAEVARGVATIRLRAVSVGGEEYDFLRVEGSLVRPGEEPVAFPLSPKGSGIHEGRVPMRGGPRALAVLRYTDPATGALSQVEVPVGGTPAEEFLETGTNEGFFGRLAEEAGATIVAPGDPLPAPVSARAAAARNPVPLILAVAALLFVADLALRRLRPDFRRLRALLPRRAATVAAPPTPGPAVPDGGDARRDAKPAAATGEPGEDRAAATGPPAGTHRLAALERARQRARDSRRFEETGH